MRNHETKKTRSARGTNQKQEAGQGRPALLVPKPPYTPSPQMPGDLTWRGWGQRWPHRCPYRCEADVIRSLDTQRSSEDGKNSSRERPPEPVGSASAPHRPRRWAGGPSWAGRGGQRRHASTREPERRGGWLLWRGCAVRPGPRAPRPAARHPASTCRPSCPACPAGSRRLLEVRGAVWPRTRRLKQTAAHRSLTSTAPPAPPCSPVSGPLRAATGAHPHVSSAPGSGPENLRVHPLGGTALSLPGPAHEARTAARVPKRSKPTPSSSTSEHLVPSQQGVTLAQLKRVPVGGVAVRPASQRWGHRADVPQLLAARSPLPGQCRTTDGQNIAAHSNPVTTVTAPPRPPHPYTLPSLVSGGLGQGFADRQRCPPPASPCSLSLQDVRAPA